MNHSDPELLAYDRAAATSSRAVALSNLGRTEEARLKHELALQMNPDGEFTAQVADQVHPDVLDPCLALSIEAAHLH